MLNYILVFSISISSSVFAASQDIDERLSNYIQEFNLSTLNAPQERRNKLFILGRNLFHERGLSGNNNIRCEDCHHPRVMTHEGIPLSLGEGSVGLQVGQNLRMQANGKVLARNTPALFNLHNVNVMFWDGRVSFIPETQKFVTPIPLQAEVSATLKSALAAQAIFPMVDHDEMRGQKGSNPIADAKDEYEAWNLIVEKVMKIPGYKELLNEVFPGESINIGHFGEALAEFQSQHFFFSETPYDKYLKGDLEALTPKQKIGMDVFFNKGKCGECHNGEHLSQFDFDSVAVPQIGPGKIDGDDYGRFQWDSIEENKYAFRVPSLRNVALTAPYFHDGSMNSLEEVINHYDDIKSSLETFKLIKQFKNYLEPLKDHDHKTDEERLIFLSDDISLKLNLTPEEKAALLDFLQIGLTDVRLIRN
jgi:cytochrome c peroxidase